MGVAEGTTTVGGDEHRCLAASVAGRPRAWWSFAGLLLRLHVYWALRCSGYWAPRTRAAAGDAEEEKAAPPQLLLAAGDVAAASLNSFQDSVCRCWRRRRGAMMLFVVGAATNGTAAAVTSAAGVTAAAAAAVAAVGHAAVRGRERWGGGNRGRGGGVGVCTAQIHWPSNQRQMNSNTSTISQWPLTSIGGQSMLISRSRERDRPPMSGVPLPGSRCGSSAHHVYRGGERPSGDLDRRRCEGREGGQVGSFRSCNRRHDISA